MFNWFRFPQFLANNVNFLPNQLPGLFMVLYHYIKKKQKNLTNSFEQKDKMPFLAHVSTFCQIFGQTRLFKKKPIYNALKCHKRWVINWWSSTYLWIIRKFQWTEFEKKTKGGGFWTYFGPFWQNFWRKKIFPTKSGCDFFPFVAS